MNKTLRTFLALGLVGLSSSAMAVTGTSLILTLADNSNVTCTFEEQPQMTFADGVLTLTTANATVGSWQFAAVDSWKFGAYDAIESVASNEGIKFNNGQIQVKAGTELAIYDLSGMKMNASVTEQDGVKSISTSGLPAGVYVLQAGKASVKFNVK